MFGQALTRMVHTMFLSNFSEKWNNQYLMIKRRCKEMSGEDWACLLFIFILGSVNFMGDTSPC